MNNYNDFGGDSDKTRNFTVQGSEGPDKIPGNKSPNGKRKKFKFDKKTKALITNILLTVLLIGIISALIIGTTFAFYIKNHLVEDYDISGLKFDLDLTTKIYGIDFDGNTVELVDQKLHGDQNRSWASISQMPKNLKNAFIAIEDKRFYEHGGVDFKRTFGATMMFFTGKTSYGGSTITQQLIKNFSHDNDATIQRKVREIFRALSLSKKRSKDEVLEMYLNTISLSNRCYGVQAASNYLFGKDVSELSLVECASLAAIPKSPYKYDPVRHPEYNKERRDLVLEEMRKLGWIEKEEYEEAINTELVLNITPEDTHSEQITSYFTDALIEQIISDLEEKYEYPREVASNLIMSGGLKIYSTVNPEIQSIMEEVFEDPNSFPKVEGIQPESAMVVMDPHTGDVVGIVGGRGEKTTSRGLNRATMSKRQVGSSIKPLTVYAPAVDLGYITYSTVIDDTPIKINENTGEYWPFNAPQRYEGKININYAILKSKNTVAVKVLEKLTPEYSYNFAKEKLGLESLVKSDMDYSPMALGGLTHGLTVMEVTSAYSMFPNNGVRSSARLYTQVYDNGGNLLLETPEKHTIAISDSTASVMTRMLENVLNYGTGTGVTLRQKMSVAGKTGSTNDDKDMYFAGYTPYYVAACWFGYDTPKYLGRFSNPALHAWDLVMTKVHEKLIEHTGSNWSSLEKFDHSDLVEASFCKDSGKIAGEACKLDPRGSRIETGYFKAGTEPVEECDCHVAVKYDAVTGGVATDGCPSENVVYVGLLNEETRHFTQNILITDSQNCYRSLPKNYVYPTRSDVPFYQNTLKTGEYVGHSGVTKPFNRVCTEHLGNISENHGDDDDVTGNEEENSENNEKAES